MRKIIGLIFMVVLYGCTLAEVQVDVLSERTTLENQVLGSYNSLDREMLLTASVRGVDAEGNTRTPPRKSQEHKDAIAALQVMDFHEDDVQAFKRLGWVGENNEGLLHPFPMDKENPPEDLKAFSDRYTSGEFDAVVALVNESRQVIMRRVIDLNENLTDAEMPEVARIFGKLNVQNALPGQRVQMEDGSWALKPEKK